MLIMDNASNSTAKIIELVLNILEEQKVGILYRPRLVKEVGSATSAILLQQMMFRWKHNGCKSFYKFKQPCSHALYREGDSWCEELAFSRAEFDTALRRIAIRKTAKVGMEQTLAQSTKERKPIIYWTDAGRVTHYDINPVALFAILEQAYLKQENDFSKSEKVPLGKDEKSLLEKQETGFTNTETTTDQPEITTEILPATAEIPPSQPSPVVAFPETDNPQSVSNDAPVEISAPVLSEGDYIEAVLNAQGRGPSPTVPPAAGGADSFGDGPIKEFCALINFPEFELPDKKRGQWASELRDLAGEWQIDAGALAVCIEAMPHSEFHFKAYSTPYQDSFKDDVAVLIGRHKAGLPLVKEKQDSRRKKRDPRRDGGEWTPAELAASAAESLEETPLDVAFLEGG